MGYLSIVIVLKSKILCIEKNLLGVVLGGVLIKILSVSIFHNVISMNFKMEIKFLKKE